MKKEIRNLTPEQTEIRANPEKRELEGYAIIFNVRSALIDGNFTEIITPDAVNGVIPNSDVLALLNHNKDKGVLARSKFGKGTLDLMVDNKGVKYRFEAPKTVLGEETLEGVKRGDIANSSFSFTIAEDGQIWEKQSDGTYQRTITQFDRIFDVSPVYDTEAYSDTSIALRSLQEFRTKETEGNEGDNGDGDGDDDKSGKGNEPDKDKSAKVPLDELSRYYDILDDKMKTY